MGRKKKTQKQAVVVQADQLGYQGSIQLQLACGNKILSTKQYHNCGMPSLWRFIATCLAGSKAEQLRPTKIKLFSYAPADNSNDSCPVDKLPDNFNWAQAFANHEIIEATPYITYSAAPVMEPKPNYDTTTRYDVILHFTIPAYYISKEKIFIVGLYPTNASNAKISKLIITIHLLIFIVAFLLV